MLPPFPNTPVREWGRHCRPALKSNSPPPPQSSCQCLGSDLERQRTYEDRGRPKGREDVHRRMQSDVVLTRHLCFRSLVVDGLAGEGVDSDLSNRHGSIFQLTVEPQHLGPFTRVLHHLDREQTDRILNVLQW